jgi:argininosuccinate lyase
MASKVSRRLAEPTAPEVADNVYAPRLARDFPACFAHLCDINQAHLLMLRATGLLPKEHAPALAKALRSIERAGAAAVPLDPVLEDAYFNYEAHLMRVAGAHVGGCLHVARSRNDILATMDRMRCRGLLVQLVERLSAARLTALDGAERHAEVVMPGYTHLQPAQPITYGYWLLAVAEVLGRDIARLQRLQQDLDRCPLGAGALAGTTFPIDRVHTARLLGFAEPVPHALDAVASRDYALELLSSLAVMSVGASRVAQDFYVWCTPEFGLVDFPDSVAGTSSIMPQKKNPVVLEYLKGKAGQLSGLLAAGLATVKGVNFTHTGDGNRESMRNVYEAADEALCVLAMLELVLRTATPNSARMLQRAQSDFGTATDLADALVRECGLSFRESHHVVGAAVRAAMDDGLGALGITSALLDQAGLDQLGRALRLDEAIVRRCLDPRQSVEARSALGGPHPGNVAAHARAAREEAQAVRARNLQRSEAFADARSALKQAIDTLADAAS